MKMYLVEAAPPAERWQSQKSAAEKLARAHAGTVAVVLVGENGRDELASLLNSREQSPLGRSFEEIRQSNTPEAQAVAKALMDPDHRPAFSQADVDAMFTPQRARPALTSADAVCHAISEMDGVPLGHVALEVAARLKVLAQAVA